MNFCSQLPVHSLPYTPFSSFSIWLHLICPLEVSCIPSVNSVLTCRSGQGMTLGSVHLDKSTYMALVWQQELRPPSWVPPVGALEGRSRPLKAPAMNWTALSWACQELPVALQLHSDPPVSFCRTPNWAWEDMDVRAADPSAAGGLQGSKEVARIWKDLQPSNDSEGGRGLGAGGGLIVCGEPVNPRTLVLGLMAQVNPAPCPPVTAQTISKGSGYKSLR